MKRLTILVAVVSGSVALLASSDTSAQGLSDFCSNVYSDYYSAPGPKAFVTEDGGGCWWFYGTKNVKQAQRKAINACANAGGYNCQVYESSY